VYFEYNLWKFAGRFLDPVNTPLVLVLDSGFYPYTWWAQGGELWLW